MAYSFKGALSFGLIYIPISLSPIIKNNDISFNLFDKKTNSRVKYKKTCVDCGEREVKQDDIVKGYEYESGKYVIFSDEDFEKIKSKKDKNITVEMFVDVNEIDPVYYDKAYYVIPSGAEKAYSLLTAAMEKEGKAALCRTVLGTKEALAIVRTRDKKMILNTLFFDDEVQKSPFKAEKYSGTDKELAMAETLIESMTGEFVPEKFEDEYRKKVLSAIEKKIAGKEIVAPKEASGEDKVLDLMKALELSLKATNKPKIKSKTQKTTKKTTVKEAK